MARGRGKGGKGESRERQCTDGAFFTPTTSSYDASTDPSYDLLADFGIDISTLDESMTAGLDYDASVAAGVTGAGSIKPPPPPDVAGEKARADEMLMQSTGALTANPMPSLPSISNVGAAPFSGSINWNAIPGGFQPLPQIVGK